MTGEIIIRAGEVPEGTPEEMAVTAINIHGDAELSAVERIAVMYNLAQALAFTDIDWEILRAMVAHEPPFDQMYMESYAVGMNGWVEADDEQDT